MQAEITVRRDGTASILVGGHDIAGAVGEIVLSARPGRPPVLNLSLPMLDEALFVADVEALISPSVYQALVALGWTPPAAPEEAS
jgi:hypothetical protein